MSENNTSSENPETQASLTNASNNVPTHDKSGLLNKLTIYFLLLLLTALCVVSSYYFWQENQKHQAEFQLTRGQLSQIQGALAQHQSSLENLSLLNDRREAAASNRLLVAEQRIEAQHKKLQGMSSTSRDDWLLAEAEYLLRLANQRVLIEHSPTSADALLTQADEILKNLDDPDLFSLRQAIAKDLASLRLIKEVDHEGIYFSIKALTEQIERLSLRPTRQELMSREDEKHVDDQLNEAKSVENKEELAQTEEDEGSVWQKVSKGFTSTITFLGQYIKVRDHSETPPALLAPDSAVYLQQNLRLKMERAQLALLREDQKIYQSSLGDAIDWVQRYYPPSQSTQAFVDQLDALQQKQIVQDLPDITYSLELLHDYIENLHKLNGVDVQTSNEQVQGEQL